MDEKTGGIEWEPDYEQARKRARAEVKEIFVYFAKPN